MEGHLKFIPLSLMCQGKQQWEVRGKNPVPCSLTPFPPMPVPIPHPRTCYSAICLSTSVPVPHSFPTPCSHLSLSFHPLLPFLSIPTSYLLLQPLLQIRALSSSSCSASFHFGPIKGRQWLLPAGLGQTELEGLEMEQEIKREETDGLWGQGRRVSHRYGSKGCKLQVPLLLWSSPLSPGYVASPPSNEPYQPEAGVTHPQLQTRTQDQSQS